jgi:hypothetical protein
MRSPSAQCAQHGAHRLAISRFYSVINSTLKIPQEAFVAVLRTDKGD